jgi:hypothetical protein
MKLTLYLFLLNTLILNNDLKSNDFLKIENCEIAKENFINQSNNSKEIIKMLDNIDCWKIKTEQDKIDEKLISDMNSNSKGWFFSDWPAWGQALWFSGCLLFVLNLVRKM